MQYFQKKRNTPIVTLIRHYTDKKGGKVAASRDEIQRRFPFLDWKDQKKLILAFLASGKTDRHWAYRQIMDYWDNAFEAPVKALWEQYHEERCAWLVVRFFPKAYLLQHFDLLTQGRNYYFACLRLAQDKTFPIDRSKLSHTDYLALLYHTHRSLSHEEATDLLYQIVHHICTDKLAGYAGLDRFASSSRENVISPVHFHEVSLALYYLRQLYLDTVVAHFEEWDEQVRNAIFKSSEYATLITTNLDDYNYNEARIHIVKKYAYNALPCQYKQADAPRTDEWLTTLLENAQTPAEPSPKKKEKRQYNDPAALKEIMTSNPAVGKLMKTFDLE